MGINDMPEPYFDLDTAPSERPDGSEIPEGKEAIRVTGPDNDLLLWVEYRDHFEKLEETLADIKVDGELKNMVNSEDDRKQLACAAYYCHQDPIRVIIARHMLSGLFAGALQEG